MQPDHKWKGLHVKCGILFLFLNLWDENKQFKTNTNKWDYMWSVVPFSLYYLILRMRGNILIGFHIWTRKIDRQDLGYVAMALQLPGSYGNECVWNVHSSSWWVKKECKRRHTNLSPGHLLRVTPVPMFLVSLVGHSASGLLRMQSGTTLLTYRKGYIEDILLDTWMFWKDAHDEWRRWHVTSNVTRDDFITDGKYEAKR